MILSAHQPAYLPWLGLFHKIALADKFVFFDDVQYVPRDWISRNQIKTPNGPLMLTVPVLEKGHREKTIAVMEINNDNPWGRKHWKSIKLNYSQAPFFNKYAGFFEDTYSKEWHLLADLNFFMLSWFLKTLGIDVIVEKGSSAHFQGSKADLVLDMCLQCGADIYIFGELGAQYADVEKFNTKGVKPLFQSYKHPIYRQCYGSFVPYMSIIDLIFNEGERSLEILMSENVSKKDIV